MRPCFGIALFGLTALAGGSAFGADCATPSGIVISPDNLTGTLFFDAFEASGGGSTSCTQPGATVPVALPSGKYGVYLVDVRGNVTQDPGNSSTYKVVVDGVTQTKAFTGAQDGDFVFSKYYNMGTAGSAAFDSAYQLTTTSGVDGASIDSVDVVARYTSRESLKASLEAVSLDKAAIVAHVGSTADLLTGSNQRLEGENEAGIIAGVGSHLFGVSARYNLSDGFSVLGGMSLIAQNYGDAGASGIVGAAALRYVEPGYNSFRLFGEGGLQLGGLKAELTRHYEDGTATGASVASGANAGLLTAYARAGVLVPMDSSSELALSATLEQSFLSIGDIKETVGADNIFAATLPGQTSRYTTIKATAAWTTALAADVDLTASTSVGAIYAHDPVAANIMFVGDVNGAPTSSLFGEAGLRLGWSPAPNMSLDGYVQGSAGTSLGARGQVGAGYRMKF